MKEPREEVRELLLAVKREGIEDLVDYLDEIGFIPLQLQPDITELRKEH